MHKWGKILLILLAISGVAIMGYLVNLHYSEHDGGTFCDLGEGLSCDIVNKSEYAEILGIPLSILGLLYFLGILALSIWKYNRSALKLLIFGSIVFLGPSLYLSYIEYFVINNICVFCELSKLLMLAIIVTAWMALRPEKFAKNALIGAVVLGIILGGATYLIQASAGPGDKYNEFAQCLDEKGFKMYGSQGCSSCARQRALFGNAFEFIEEIECNPQYPNPQTELCVAKNIEGTPTWMQEDESDNELLRLDAGWKPIPELSEVSGCALPEALTTNEVK